MRIVSNAFHALLPSHGQVRFTTSLIVFALAVTVLAGAGPLFASSIAFNANASADVFGYAGGSQTITSPGSATASSSGTEVSDPGTQGNGCPTTTISAAGSASSSVTGTADYGYLSGAGAITGSQQATYDPVCGVVVGPRSWYTSYNVTSSWSDTVTFDPGTYTITLDFFSIVGDALGCDGYNHPAPASYAGADLSMNGPSFSLTNQNNCSVQGLQTASGLITFNSVTTRDITGDFSVSGVGPWLGGGAPAYPVTDASSGWAEVFIDGTGNVTSASGHDYSSSAVPEPATIGLIGISLLSLGLRRWRTRL